MDASRSHALEMVPILTFTLGIQQYALQVEEVVEVAAMVELVTVPDDRPEVLGVVNRHGEVLPLIDLRRIIVGEAGTLDEWTLFLVAKHRHRLIGVVVDEVQQVEYVPAAQIHQSSASGKYIRGIISYKQQLVQLVDLASLWVVYWPEVMTEDVLKVNS